MRPKRKTALCRSCTWPTDIVSALPEATCSNTELAARVAACSQHVQANQLLDKYHVAQPLSFFLSLQPSPSSDSCSGQRERQQAEQGQASAGRERDGCSTTSAVALSAVKPAFSDKQWSELLTDLLTLQQPGAHIHSRWSQPTRSTSSRCWLPAASSWQSACFVS